MADSVAYDLQTQFAVDNFIVGNEAHSIQNKMRLKYVGHFPLIDKESIETQKQSKGKKRKRSRLQVVYCKGLYRRKLFKDVELLNIAQDNQDEEDNDNMSDSSSSIVERKEMKNVFLEENESEQEEIWEDEDLEERAEEADVSILEEPSVAPDYEGSLMSNDAWTVAMSKIEQYRKKIPASNRLFE
jgi:hypothetical protein